VNCTGVVMSVRTQGPIRSDVSVLGEYAVTWFRSRSYGLTVTLSDELGGVLARADLASVFINPGTLRPVVPDAGIAARLRGQIG
jgi:hypothetical protein